MTTEYSLALGGPRQTLGRRLQLFLRSGDTGSRLLRTMGAQALVVLLNVATGVLTARQLGPSGRGLFAAVTLWPQLIASVAAGGLPFAMVYLGSGARPAGARRVIGATLLIGVGVGVACAVIGAIAIPYAMGTHYPAGAVHFAQATTFVGLVNLLVVLCRQALVARGRVADFNVSSWLDPALYLGLLLCVCASGRIGFESAALCMYGAGVLGLGWTARRLWRVCPPRLRGLRDWWPRIASYAGRASGRGLLSSLADYLDRLVLAFALPPRELGLYAVAYSMSRLANIVHTAIGAVVLPVMTAAGAAEAKALHDATFRLVLLVMVLGVALSVPLGGPALAILYGPEFANAETVLLVLVGEAALSCLCQVVVQLFLARGCPGFASWAQCAGFAAMMLGLLLAPLLGALGAALAVAAGTCVRLLVLLAGVRLRLQLPLPRPASIRADLRVLGGRIGS